MVLAGGVVILHAYNWTRPLILYREEHSEAFQLDEGFLVVLCMLEPPKITLAVMGTAIVVGQALRRRPLGKSAFNLAQAIVAVGAALAVQRLIAPPHGGLTFIEVFASSVGAATYFVVATAELTLLLAMMSEEPLKERLHKRLTNVDLKKEAKSWEVQLAMAGSATLVGEMVVVTARYADWATWLAVPMLFVLRMLASEWFKAEHDRQRHKALYDLAHDAGQFLSHEIVLESVVRTAKRELRGQHAELSTDPPSPDEISRELEVGGTRQWLTVSGRMHTEPLDEGDELLLEGIVNVAKAALTNADLYRQVGRERARLASITFNIGEGVCAVDLEGRLTLVNRAAQELIRIPAERNETGELVAPETLQAPEFLLGPARMAMEMASVVREEEAIFEAADGSPLPVAYTASAVREKDAVIGAVISFRDITERKKLESIMAHQALYDSLTGLANRRLLVDRLEKALERAKADRRTHALIFLDVDRFKAINDSLGHGTGDSLLVGVASRLEQVAGPNALVARFGGDEFVVFMENVSGVEDAVAVARQICDAAQEPLLLRDGRVLVASLSVGIALTSPEQATDDVIRDADVAMYWAKNRGGSFQVFDREVMGIRSSERLDLETALRRGIERGELELFYQPVVSVVDQRIVGAEALVRWHHPNGELMTPERFIPVAEETGLILPIGTFVLNESCRQIAQIRDRMGRDLPISVNLSPRQFQQGKLLDEVASALDSAGLPSHLLKFEITETMVMDNLKGATDIMNRLSRLGVLLAIDDFGTGHSSLAYLKTFPVHEVKVDRTFVQNLAHDPVDRAIVRAVVDLADAMGIPAVAEGVEQPEQLACLEELGCHRAQGYLFSRPLSSSDLIELLERQPLKIKPGRPARLRLL
jgi:diguanylate cyclase (GGDEF)-like protein/PAS domain S-box-containing protein